MKTIDWDQWIGTNGLDGNNGLIGTNKLDENNGLGPMDWDQRIGWNAWIDWDQRIGRFGFTENFTINVN